MPISRLALIGTGNIASQLIPAVSDRIPTPLESLAVLVRPETATERRDTIGQLGRALATDVVICTSIAQLLAARPSLLVECASHTAVRQFVPTALSAGIETVIASVGALVDPQLQATLVEAARRGGTRLVIPAGAIGGLDAVRALSIAGIDSLQYRGRKPPAAWRNTAAEPLLDALSAKQGQCFYSGTARKAASEYPRNANVAAALALAGTGFEHTDVELFADAHCDGNVHEFELQSPVADVRFRISAKPSVDNPKTSLLTVYSLAREILNRIMPISV